MGDPVEILKAKLPGQGNIPTEWATEILSALGYGELEAIVRDLAKRDPIWEQDDLFGCDYCSNEFNDRAHGQRPPTSHREWCLWRRAVEWVDVSDRVVGEVSTKPGRPDV